MKRKRKESKIVLIIPVLILMTGISVFIYPIVSSYIARKQQENVIVGYENTISQTDEKKLRYEWEKARDYVINPDSYMNVLNLEGDGVMGYIEIPKINVRIPIYHYANESSLKKGVGHMEQTDLPIGNKGNHPVLTGHRGLPNAELFTRLDEIEIGDYFYLYVLDKNFTYKVNKITIVLPEEVKSIKKENERDLVTLVTCTPYGINTHRLLVTGERTENVYIQDEKEEVKESGRFKIIICIFIMFAGLSVIIYPHISNKIYEKNIEKSQNLFISKRSYNEQKYERLYKVLKRKNQILYENRQENFSSVSAYQNAKINLRLYGINDNIIGYITIPEMKVTLPIFLGANEKNMKKGAVHLTETSYPVGGRNTNCVIAAHRGYSKQAMFREIEKLEIGDKVFIQNFREKLTYKVVEIKIISPTDKDQVLIERNKDMITLITCHPYRKNTRRYVVFCERI